MTPSWVDLLFRAGGPLVYVATLAGKTYATQWTLYEGPDASGLHRLTFLAEMDPAATGAGGALVRQRTRLWCTDGLDPVHYANQVQGVGTTLDFAAGDVTAGLPDGSTQIITRAGARFVIDGNLPGMLALLYAALAGDNALAARTSLGLFFAGQLVTVPFETAPAPGASAGLWHHTTHDEDVLLDARGVMQEVRVAKIGFRAALVLDAPALPAWPEDLSPDHAPLKYTAPARPGFRLEDVTIAGPVTPLGATLSIPDGAGPFPSVLFLGGSGTHDRHGIAGEIDIGTHEIMDGLAESGFVGLRFDARGAGTTRLGADTLDRGLASDIADARACLAYLRDRSEGAGQPLFLLGHSQGATVALALATEPSAPPLHGIALMAAMGRDFADVIADQVRGHGAAVGYTPEQLALQLAEVTDVVTRVRSGVPWEPGSVPDHILAIFRTPTWLKEFLAFQNLELIARAPCPVLICQGLKDFQVSARRDAEPLVAAAQAAGVSCSYAPFEDLDHLFKRCDGDSTLASYYSPRPVDPAFRTRLTGWLRDQTRRVSG